MLAALLLALCGVEGIAPAQAADPRIEDVERLSGPVARPTLWSVLAVTVSSAGGFEGEVAVRSSFGFMTVHPVRVAREGRVRVLVPSIDPDRLSAGAATGAIPPTRTRADRIVGVDERLSYAGELVSDESVFFQVIREKDLSPLLGQGMGEIFDLVLVAPSADLPAPALRAGTREEADRALEAMRKGAARPRLEIVDPVLWTLARPGDWVPGKRGAAVLFAAAYAMAGFVAIILGSRRSARAGVGTLVLVAFGGAGAFWAFFPRGQVWVEGVSCERVDREGRSEEWALWFAGAGGDRVVTLAFPRLVKPVLPGHAPFDPPFALRVGERGCEVAGLRLDSGRSVCLGWVSPQSAPTLKLDPGLSGPLYRATLVAGGKFRELGDLAVGAAIPRGVEGTGGAPPPETEFAGFGRWVGQEGVFGWLEREGGPVAEVRSAELGSQALRRPRCWVKEGR